MADRIENVETPRVEREPPSLPSSPAHKKTKIIEPANNLSVASILNDTKPTTPSPTESTTLPTMNTSASTLPSLAQAPPPPPLQVKLLSPTAKAPTRGSAFAAGYDLYASQPSSIPARGKALIETDISIAVPVNTYGRVAPRSGLAAKHSIDVGAGVIDADYRGPVKVLLFNFSDKEFEVAVGDRVAQLIVERILTPEVVVVLELEESGRGAGGFGSTGGFGGVLMPAVGGANGTV